MKKMTAKNTDDKQKMTANNGSKLCLEVPETVDPLTVAFITDLCGKYGFIMVYDIDKSIGNVVAQESVGNAVGQHVPNDEDQKTVVLITEGVGCVVLKILIRLATLVGCAVLVYDACKIADGVDKWKELDSRFNAFWYVNPFTVNGFL